MPYDKSTQKKYGENPLPQKKSGFKMKGSPMKRNFGIGADSPMKETTIPSYTGANIDPKLSYEYKGVKIPSFRDMISLEQQQAYAKKVDEKRFKKKKDKYNKRTEEERPERERQELAAQGELHSEEAAIEQREKNKRKQEAERRANEPIDYDALELPEEEFPEENA